MDNRTFPGAGGTHDANCFSCFDLKRNIVEYFIGSRSTFVQLGKRNVGKSDIAADRCRNDRVFFFNDARFFCIYFV